MTSTTSFYDKVVQRCQCFHIINIYISCSDVKHFQTLQKSHLGRIKTKNKTKKNKKQKEEEKKPCTQTIIVQHFQHSHKSPPCRISKLIIITIMIISVPKKKKKKKGLQKNTPQVFFTFDDVHPPHPPTFLFMMHLHEWHFVFTKLLQKQECKLTEATQLGGAIHPALHRILLLSG